MGRWDLYDKEKPFAALVGKTLVSIAANGDHDEVTFKASDGSEFLMYHSQGCCESVTLNEVVGDFGDLLQTPILEAEVVSNKDGDPKPEYPDSWTWTFYKLATAKGRVTLRWLGESNGYYSESVDFAQTKEPASLNG